MEWLVHQRTPDRQTWLPMNERRRGLDCPRSATMQVPGCFRHLLGRSGLEPRWYGHTTLVYTPKEVGAHVWDSEERVSWEGEGRDGGVARDGHVDG